MLGKIRRGRLEGTRPEPSPAPRDARALPEAPADPSASSSAPSPGFGSGGWDHTAGPPALRQRFDGQDGHGSSSLRAQLISLFADPRVQWITIESAARVLEAPRADVETVIAALVQSGELIERGDASRRFRVPHAEKQRLESMFREAALELGEQGVLAPIEEDALAVYDDDPEEPRLPVTAGLLSLFLPGTGQLLNGDVGRASLVFAVWSLAWITHLSPVWTFVCLYAGAEAFFTAKLRSMERKMAKEALPAGGSGPQALPPPKPQQG